MEEATEALRGMMVTLISTVTIRIATVAMLPASFHMAGVVVKRAIRVLLRGFRMSLLITHVP